MPNPFTPEPSLDPNEAMRQIERAPSFTGEVTDRLTGVPVLRVLRTGSELAHLVRRAASRFDRDRSPRKEIPRADADPELRRQLFESLDAEERSHFAGVWKEGGEDAAPEPPPGQSLRDFTAGRLIARMREHGFPAELAARFLAVILPHFAPGEFALREDLPREEAAGALAADLLEAYLAARPPQEPAP